MTNTIRFYIIDGIVLAGFLIVSLVCPFVRTIQFWIAFAFGILAIALQALSIPNAFRAGESVKSKFYGFPLARVSALYLIAQMVLSLLFMLFSENLKTWVEIVLCSLLLSAALIGFIAADAARTVVRRQDAVLKKDTSAMTALRARSAAVAAMRDLPELKALAEEFRFSDPVSSDATRDAETRLALRLDDLSEAVSAGDEPRIRALSAQIRAMLSERNALCKAGK